MARPRTRTKRSTKTKTLIEAGARDESLQVRVGGWPEVLTLTEAAAYLQVSEADLSRIVASHDLPGRQIGSEWRFSRAAIQDWLRRPSMKESLLRLAGSWKDDPYLGEMLDEIYRQRGRPMTEDSQ